MKIISGLEKKIEIDTLDKWFKYCPPQKGEKQWKDLYSAKEMAKFWLSQKNQNDFQKFIKNIIPDFEYDYLIPEFESNFDNFGSPRKHDLFIAGTNNRAIVTIEGKANEPFGKNEFGTEFINSIKTKIETPDSNKLNRIINLYQNYFHSNGNSLVIMYQILHWFAGSLIDAIKQSSENVVMVLQEFKNSNTDSDIVSVHHNDFDNFVEFISEGKFKQIYNGQIIGPIENKYTDTKGEGVKKLYIGNYLVDLNY